MDVNLLTPLIAFAAGLLSCLSPCVLPLLPAYVANLTGVSVVSAGLGVDRGTAARHSLSFILGFTVVFVALGASVGFVGYAVRDQAPLLQKVGGLFMIAMGLQVAGVIQLPWLGRTFTPTDSLTNRQAAGAGYARSVGLGSALAAGWTPCLGPTLGGILTMAAASRTAPAAAGLLLAYSAGLAVPFLAAGLVLDRTNGWIRRMRPVMPLISVASGVVLMSAGVLLYTDALASFNRFFSFSGPGTAL